ncbi:MAG: lysozyme, partial [Zoogloea sp.]|nr:lysozyme [Zoogloea sp.]
GITRAEAVYLCGNDIDRVAGELDAHLPWWRSLDEVRQHVLMNMCFNLGIQKLQAFKNTLSLVQAGQYEAAARAMLASLWAQQVGDRAKRLAKEMETGKEAA